MSSSICARILTPNICNCRIVKQPFMPQTISQQSSSASSSWEGASISSQQSQQINQTVITIQTFKSVREKYIISACYVQNDQKISCNYTFDRKDYLTFPVLQLESKPQNIRLSQSTSEGSIQSASIAPPRRLVKKEDQIPKSKNAAKNITKAFVRHLKELRGENDKSYKDLVKFVKTHKYNNKNLKTIAQKESFANEFQIFCQGLAQKWVESCDIQDKEMHIKILNAFMNQDYEMLKEHKKRIKKRFAL